MEGIIDTLRRTCQALGLPIRSMEVEMGPSQIEFTFDPADPMTHADNMVMLGTAVKEVCQRQGLHATFMCKPKVENGAASGWHLHQSVVDLETGQNLFMPEGEALSETCSAWIAGLLAHAHQSCVLSTPTVNGYKRYQPHQLAPDRAGLGPRQPWRDDPRPDARWRPRQPHREPRGRAFGQSLSVLRKPDHFGAVGARAGADRPAPHRRSL